MGILRVVRQLHEQERMRTPAVVSRSQTAIFLLYLDGKKTRIGSGTLTIGKLSCIWAETIEGAKLFGYSRLHSGADVRLY